MNAPLRLQLLGALRLVDADGSDLTPRSAKAQGLLAILAVSGGQRWNRAALQDLLWSDRDHGHGRDSLKKALRDLRLCLNANGRSALFSDGGPVSLDMAQLAVDLFEEAGPGTGYCRQEFLAGIDVRDPNFEDWLRETRTAIANQSGSDRPRLPDNRLRRRLHVAVRPTATLGGDGDARFLADHLIDRILIALRHYDLYRIHDLRDPSSDEMRGGDVLIESRAHMLGTGRLALGLLCRRSHDDEVLWAGQFRIATEDLGSGRGAALVSETVTQIGDRLLRQTARDNDGERQTAARHAMDGIDRIFTLSRPDLVRAAGSLRTAINLDPRGSYYAWYAFLASFRLEITKGRDRPELMESSEALARRALEIDPHNPLTRSILTHVYSFLFRDFERAETLIRPLDANPPDLPMYHQSRALLDFYTGRMDQAEDHARKARLLGANWSNAYIFSTTNAMVALARGDVDGAIRFGTEAMNLQAGRPRLYEPAMRYLAAAHGYAGDLDKAGALIALIRRQSPAFTIDSMRAARFPVPSPAARELLLGGLLPHARQLDG